MDFALHRSAFDCLHTLTPKGNYGVVGGGNSRILHTVLVGAWLSLAGSKKIGLLLHKVNKGLDGIKRCWMPAKFALFIDRRYPLSKVAEAFSYFGAVHAKGKLVITVRPERHT